MLRAGGGRGIFKRATAAVGGGAYDGWLPSDVTLTETMIWEAFDAAATLYTDVAGTTEAMANADPVGNWPTQRAATVDNYAYPSISPDAGNMTYAASLLTGDATHPRAVRLPPGLARMYQLGDKATLYYRAATTSLFAIRVRVSTTGAVADWCFPLNKTTVTGFGVGFRESGGVMYYGATSEPGVAPIASSTTVDFDTWVSLVLVADNTGGSLYVDDATTPVLTSASLAIPYASWDGLRMMEAMAFKTVDIHRAIFGNGIDLAEAPVADVMAWLEAN